MSKIKNRPILQYRLGIGFCVVLLGFCILPRAEASISTIASDIQSWAKLGDKYLSAYIQQREAQKQATGQTVDTGTDKILKNLHWGLGKLSMPIAGQTPPQIQNLVSKVSADSGTYTFNAAKLKSALMGEANKQYSDAQAKIVMDEKGQQNTQDALQANAKVVGSSSDSAELIQNMTVSQDILREQSQIHANNSVILGSIYEELVASRINATLGNQNNAVLAADVHRKNWDEEVTKTLQRAYVIRSMAESFSYGLSSHK